MHHQQTLWVYWTLPLLGIWMILSPLSLGHLNEAIWVDPSGGRGPWFAERSTAELRELRAWLMTASDLLCGLVLLVCGWRSLQPNRPYSLWACCGVGVWLTFAPIVFWAPTAASYANDSLVVSRYLAMFQLGYIDHVWDPLFGFEEGTKKVLNSKLSHLWPISDGGLGAISYTFEFLMGYMGSPARWRTMPWMVAFFGFLVIPLGLTHIILVVSQPLIVHAWCSICLLAALIMLPMIPLEVDEVIAMFQHVRQAKKRGILDRSRKLDRASDRRDTAVDDGIIVSPIR
ncbi:MAG: vitamin K epoxide reductase family protein [Novipirellula sp. JB048]